MRNFVVAAALMLSGSLFCAGCGEETSAELWEASYSFEENGDGSLIFGADGMAQYVDMDCTYQISDTPAGRRICFAEYEDGTGIAPGEYYISVMENEQIGLTADLEMDQAEEEQIWKLSFDSGEDGLRTGTKVFEGIYVNPEYQSVKTYFYSDGTCKSAMDIPYELTEDQISFKGDMDFSCSYVLNEEAGTLVLTANGTDITLYRVD